MDNGKIGELIHRLRRERGLTQLQMAERLGVSDKAVSKWERGLGCPELSLLPELAEALEVDMGKLLSGELAANDRVSGNVNRLRFWVCPSCGNVVTGLTDTGVSCCGKRLRPLTAQKADEEHSLTVQRIETEYFVSSGHPMEREHHIAFLALVKDDSLLLRKLYPEWELQTRLPFWGHSRLYFYCTQHGLFWQNV